MSYTAGYFYRATFRLLIMKYAPRVVAPLDLEYYSRRYPDIEQTDKNRHFARSGWREGRSPAAGFDILAYIMGEPMAVVRRQVDLNDRPYIRAAASSTTIPVPACSFAKDYVDIVDSGLFDRDFYSSNYPQFFGDEVEHYLRSGWIAGCNPGPNFSTVAYLQRYPDVARSGMNPLIHFIRFGRQENRITQRPAGPRMDDRALVQSEPYCPPIEERRRALQDRIKQRLLQPESKCSLDGPLISLLVPVYDVPTIWFKQMLDSVRHQTYANWQLCIVDDCSTIPELRQLLSELTASDPRVCVKMRAQNGGISAASNDALAMANGEYVALLDNDDMLTNDALEEMVKAVNASGGPDWLYSDEFKIDDNNNVSDLFAKPDWSPSMLLNYMYTGHLTLYKTEIVRSVGGFRSQYDFSQDYDLALRISEMDVKIVHVEQYLYAWRMIATSAASGGKPTARISNIAALQDAMDRRGWIGDAIPLPTANRVMFKVGTERSVSIIIPSDSEDNIRASIDSIFDGTIYKNYEIIVVTNSRIVNKLSLEYSLANIVWARYDKPFNFSDKCNCGAAVASGDHIVFFNDDVRVISQNWIEALLEYLTLPGVGAVGPKLLYENGLIQHGGMGTGMRRLVGTVFHCYPDNSPVHFNFAQCVRDISIICGALIAMPAWLFEKIGGFDAVNAPIGHSDVDLCFRIREAGYRCVYTPYAKMVHIGHASIGEVDGTKKAFKRDKSEVFLLKRWCNFIARDPYFTPAMRELTYIDSPENFKVFAGSPCGDRGDVLILSHDLSTSGAPKVAYDLAVLMKSRGYFVTVASPTDGPFRERLTEQGITVIIDELILTGHESSMVLARSFDLVIANTIVCWQSVSELSKTTPTYLYSHETELVHHFANTHPDFIVALRSATQIWCGSQHASDALLRYGLAADVVEYGVNDIAVASSRAADKSGGAKVKIGLFGSVEPRKGQDLAVLGMRNLDAHIRELAQLTLYGRTLDPGFLNALEPMVRDTPEVMLGGELDYEQYRSALADTDIVIVCSRDDTLPLVSLDALSLGKALVCSAATGTSRYLEHGRSALILKDNDPAEIGEALARLIMDAELRQTIGNGARAVFESSFTYDAFGVRVFNRLNAPTMEGPDSYAL